MDQTQNPRRRRELSTLVILIVAIATPATLALSYYHITGDPTFRPLALTVERLVASGQIVDEIDVQGFVIAGRSAESRKLGVGFARKLERAFFGKGLDARIRLHPEPTDGSPSIIFLSGNETFGPFEMHDAPRAVRVVSEATKARRDLDRRSYEYSR